MGNRLGSIKNKMTNNISGTYGYSIPSSPDESTSVNKTVPFETFILIWLDPNVDTSEENKETQKSLRKILTCLITFDKTEPCERWLQRCSLNEKIILIVSGAYGREIVPKIHHLQVLVAIHVYCLDVSRNNVWAKNFEKVRNVTSSTNILLEKLSCDQTNLESVEDSKALQIYDLKQHGSPMDIRTVSFICYQLLLEILISPNYIPTQGTYYELIHILRQYSFDDSYGMELINEFKRTYDPRTAISWLNRDTPLSRFVNKALREQDIQMLFALRFLLVDIRKQLVTHQAPSIHVFKLQPMLTSEMEHVRANPGQLMVVNGFLFASIDRSQLISTATYSNQYETVLFDIEAEYRSDVAPFAFLHDIDPTIQSKADRNILFMCGAIFEVGALLYEESIWILRLKLAGDTDSVLLLDSKKKIQKTKNLSIVGDLLNKVNQQEKATVYYERLFQELPAHITFIPITNQPKTDSKPIINYCASFVLVNLSSYMSQFSLTVLDILCSMTSNLLTVINDVSMVDFSRWPTESVSIFTSASSVSTIKIRPENCKLFILDDSNNDNDINQHIFKTIDELLCKLADDIVQYYRFLADDYVKNNNLKEAEEQIKKINRIYSELSQINDKFSTNSYQSKESKSPKPILIWLISNTQSKATDIKYIQESLSVYFSSYQIFYNLNDFESYLANEENKNNLFIIIDCYYDELTLHDLDQCSSVKYIYHYGESRIKTDNIISNQDDLRYRLASNLMDYYAKLGEHYRANKKSKLSREMFSNARHLCSFLSENCF